jgi:hypothetical protein
VKGWKKMSKLNEKEIITRLEEFSKISPNPEAISSAKQKVRDLLLRQQEEYIGLRAKRSKMPFVLAAAKFAATVLIFVGLGFIAGRLSASKQVDVEQLRAALETSLKSSLEQTIKNDVLRQVQENLKTASAANNAALKEELLQKVNLYLSEFAERTTVASQQMNEQMFTELVALIEEARQRDRQQVEAALAQIRQQTAKFGSGLVALASQTEEILHTR